jgi:hypothetical protein
MLRRNVVVLPLALLASLAAGCGGSSSVTGLDPAVPASASGHAVVQGTVQGARSGVQVGVVGTPLVAAIDEEGQFALAGVPAGTATLRFEGGGIDARLSVSGLQDGQVTSITVQLSGGGAQLAGTPSCSPTTETYFTGTLDRANGTSLVVGGRSVDASRVQKVWRGDRRIQLSDLEVGEKVKVWGTLRGDGVLVAEEIKALGKGSGSGDTWVTFRGRVDSVSSSALDVHGNPYAPPTLVVAGRKVKTDGATRFKWSDGTALDPGAIRSGDQASVEGWAKPEGHVLASKIVVDCR